MIDAHLHLWDPAANRHPWLAGEPRLHRPFLVSDLDPAGHGIDGLIVVEAGCDDGQAELDWLGRLAEQWPVIAGVVVQVPLELGQPVAAMLAAAVRHPLTAGVRRNLQDEPPGFIAAAPMVQGVRRLAP